MSTIIIDSVIRLKNGYMSGREKLVLQFSRLNEETLAILKKEGYVKDYKVIDDSGKKSIEVILLYNGIKPALSDVKIVSKSGRRIYQKTKHLPHVLGGLGLAIMTTSKGVMTSTDASKNKIGGEVLFKIW